MEGSVKSDARLEVSVSFGRFENDALSWEKWSAFSPNKYLEEVGSLSTPGSVAQKKAYFEAHYKKIAAKKAEELEQDNKSMYHPIIPISNVSSAKEHNAENPPCADANSNGPRSVEEVDQKSRIIASSIGQTQTSSVEEVTQESCVTSLSSLPVSEEAEEDTCGSLERLECDGSTNVLVDETISHEKKEDDVTVIESIEESKDNLIGNVIDPMLEAGEEVVLVSTEARRKNSEKIVEKTLERKKGIERRSSALKKEEPKVTSRNIAQKVTPVKKERESAAAKKKVITPSAKPLQASTPRQPKPRSISTPISSTQSLKKKVNSAPLPKIKKPLVGESKKIAPTSLHMSLSLSPANSPLSIPMTRKSLIMEKMGDKDIVKRAFKAFQNRTSGFSADEKPVLSPASQSKVVAPRTAGYGNRGLRKDSHKLATPKSQSVTRSSYPIPSNKSSPLYGKNSTALSPAVSLKSDDRAEKRKEFLKKLEARSRARVAENARILAKAKDKDSSLKV